MVGLVCLTWLVDVVGVAGLVGGLVVVGLVGWLCLVDWVDLVGLVDFLIGFLVLGLSTWLVGLLGVVGWVDSIGP